MDLDDELVKQQDSLDEKIPVKKTKLQRDNRIIQN